MLVNGCSLNTDASLKKDSNDNEVKGKTVSLNETFEYEDFEITIGNGITFPKNDNQYDKDYGKTLIRVPVTIKNIKNETNSTASLITEMIYPNGDVGYDGYSYYFDDSIVKLSDLKQRETKTVYLYYLYTGDGTYTIRFNNLKNNIDVVFNVKK